MAGDRKTLLWRPAACDDIEALLEYYSRVAGIHTAIKMLRKIENASHILAEYPFAGTER